MIRSTDKSPAGGWVLAEKRHDYDQIIRDASNNPVCSVVLAGWDKISQGKHGRLIAAAPELLWFVQQIFDGIDTGILTLDTPADETLANILAKGRIVLAKVSK